MAEAFLSAPNSRRHIAKRIAALLPPTNVFAEVNTTNAAVGLLVSAPVKIFNFTQHNQMYWRVFDNIGKVPPAKVPTTNWLEPCPPLYQRTHLIHECVVGAPENCLGKLLTLNYNTKNGDMTSLLPSKKLPQSATHPLQQHYDTYFAALKNAELSCLDPKLFVEATADPEVLFFWDLGTHMGGEDLQNFCQYIAGLECPVFALLNGRHDEIELHKMQLNFPARKAGGGHFWVTLFANVPFGNSFAQ